MVVAFYFLGYHFVVYLLCAILETGVEWSYGIMGRGVIMQAIVEIYITYTEFQLKSFTDMMS